MKTCQIPPPIITIVVPAYNVAPYIKDCIDSVLNQTYDNWELLLMAGGQDDTIKICDEYATKDIRIKSFHDNKGLVQARNAGFKQAIGEWITYLDGDDWLDKETVEALTNVIETHPNVDVVFWHYIEELENKTIDKWSHNSEDCSLWTEYDATGCKELSRKVLLYKYGLSDGTCKLVNMKYAKDNNIYHDARLSQGSEGVEFSLRAFYHAKSAIYVNRCFYHYRYTPNSISHKVDENNTRHLADCYNVIWEDIQKFENKEQFIPAFYERTVYMLIAIAMNTYFNPSNKSSLKTKVKHYSMAIKGNVLFNESIKKTSTKNMDIYRKIVVVILRLHLYTLLAPIAWAKQVMLKMGYYNY